MTTDAPIQYGPAPPPVSDPVPDKSSGDLGPEGDLPCLLWDKDVDDPDNPDAAAMQALMYDECTATERAENFKVDSDGSDFIDSGCVRFGL